jgi:hypothetical protein
MAASPGFVAPARRGPRMNRIASARRLTGRCIGPELGSLRSDVAWNTRVLIGQRPAAELGSWTTLLLIP